MGRTLQLDSDTPSKATRFGRYPTLAVGEYGAAVVIVLMLTGGEALEQYAASRATGELTALLEQAPQSAHLLESSEGAAQDSIRDVPVTDVVVGDHLLVRPGEVTPVDGELLSDSGSFDMAALTGESLPVELHRGEEVPSGAVNGDEAVRIVALRKSADSQYQQIVALVEAAQDEKAPVVRVADRFALPFTALSLLIAGTAWIISGDPVRFAEVLVLATPCPLLIAAPVAFMGGLSRSAKNGVIFKGGAVLEELSRVRSAAFDKTGTITAGHSELARIVAEDGFTEEEVLRLAASAEQYSGHILALSIVASAEEMRVPLASASKAEEETGLGVKAVIDGQDIVVGSRKYAESAVASAHSYADVILQPGEVAAYVAVDGRAAGAVVMADQMRADSPALISYLRSQGITSIEMLTGDTPRTAEEIARAAGITTVHAGLRPDEKVRLVGNLEPAPTMMVGDGVNDAPALAAANVGIAMGARGATAAGEAADVVIVPDSVWKVAEARAISQHTMKVALTAIWIGIILSVGLMLVATTGIIPAMVGALMQEVVDLATILYALRALVGPLPSAKQYLGVNKSASPNSPLHEGTRTATP